MTGVPAAKSTSVKAVPSRAIDLKSVNPTFVWWAPLNLVFGIISGS